MNTPDGAAPSGLAQTRESMRARFARKKDEVKEALKPWITKTETIVFQAFEVTDQKDKEELTSRVSSVVQHILSPVNPQTTEDGALKETVEGLDKLVQKARTVLAEEPSKAKEVVAEKRAEMIMLLIRELDGLRGNYLTVQVGRVTDQVSGLEAKFKDLNMKPGAEKLAVTSKPANPKVLCGREELVTKIVQRLLEDSACRFPLLGPGGIGKTSVAAAVMHHPDIKQKFGKDLFFIGCEGVVSADGIVNALARLCGTGPNSRSEDEVLEVLGLRTCVLLVLDNFETPLESPDSEAVGNLLVKLGDLENVSLVLTMRGNEPPSGVDWEDAAPVPKLSLDASKGMWIALGQKVDEQLPELLQRLDGLPLAIHLIARQAQVMKRSAAHMLALYEAEAAKVVKFGRESRLTSLEISIQLSLDSPIMA